MGIRYRIYLKILVNYIDLVWWFVRNFMPKTHERWEREIKEHGESDFLADYNNEMFWQQQNGR